MLNLIKRGDYVYAPNISDKPFKVFENEGKEDFPYFIEYRLGHRAYFNCDCVSPNGLQLVIPATKENMEMLNKTYRKRNFSKVVTEADIMLDDLIKGNGVFICKLENNSELILRSHGDGVHVKIVGTNNIIPISSLKNKISAILNPLTGERLTPNEVERIITKKHQLNAGIFA